MRGREVRPSSKQDTRGHVSARNPKSVRPAAHAFVPRVSSGGGERNGFAKIPNRIVSASEAHVGDEQSLL